MERANIWMKVPEAAQYFGVPRSRMYELIQKGEVPAVRLGQRSIRVNVREVEEFLIENRRIISDGGSAGEVLSARIEEQASRRRQERADV